MPMDSEEILIPEITLGKGRKAVRQRSLVTVPFFSLLRLEGGAPLAMTRVLVVEPLSGVRAPLLFDMLSNLVKSCDVYVLVWRDPASVPASAGAFGLQDNIDAIAYALGFLGAGVHVIGLCQSVLPVLAAVSVLCAAGAAERPVSMALLGGKLDTRIRPARIDQLARNVPIAWFSASMLTRVPWFCAGVGRRVFSANMQACFTLSYIGRHLCTGGEICRKMLEDQRDGLAPGFLDLLLSPMAIPGEFCLDLLAACFQDSALAEGRLHWHGLRVDPAAIRDVALLTIEGEEDDIAPPGQTFVAHGLCCNLPASLRTHHLEPGIGHFGLFHGQVWRTVILPRLLDAFAVAARAGRAA